MRTYSFVNGVFRCDIEYRSQLGFLEYDFNLGVFHSEKPSGVPSLFWLIQLIKFAKIALKFVEPIGQNNESL